jgi:MSHA pilin protein MshC
MEKFIHRNIDRFSPVVMSQFFRIQRRHDHFHHIRGDSASFRKETIHMSSRICIQNSKRGFTIIEILSILIILGILATVVFSRIDGNSEAVLVNHVNMLKSHLRYAQIRALNSDSAWGIKCDGSVYWLFSDSSKPDDSKVRFPDQENEEVTISGSVTIDSFTIIFDEWGRPNDVSLNILTNDFTISLNDINVIITRDTGFLR